MKYSRIRTHFKQVDPIIYPIIDSINFADRIKPRHPSQYFTNLCREIISQQLSGKAADAIEKKFVDIFPNQEVTPAAILGFSDQKLRNVGLSWAKVTYIKDLATKTIAHEIDMDNLHEMTDDEVVFELIKVKGIGQWTAEMFLIFTLGRENIFSHGDLGLRKAIHNLYQLSELNVNKINSIVNKWSPYKTYGSLALWHSLDNR